MKSNGLTPPAASEGVGALVFEPRSVDYSLAASRALFSEGLSAISRAARCYLLMQLGSINLPIAPRPPEVVEMDPRQRVEAAAFEAFRECLDQIATNLVVVERLDDIEGPHQLRNGAKRLRVALAAFAPALPLDEVKRLDGQARWLVRKAGELRDLDVAASIAVQEAEAHPGETGWRKLAHLLSGMAGEHRQHLQATLARNRARRLLVDLARLVESLSPGERLPAQAHGGPLVDLAADAIDRRWTAVRVHAPELDGLNTAQRHKLRKTIKSLRYTVQLFETLFCTGRAEPFARSLKDIHAALGDQSDAEMLKQILDEVSRNCSDPAVKRAIETLNRAKATKAEHSLDRVRGIWSGLIHAEPFWERRGSSDPTDPHPDDAGGLEQAGQVRFAVDSRSGG